MKHLYFIFKQPCSAPHRMRLILHLVPSQHCGIHVLLRPRGKYVQPRRRRCLVLFLRGRRRDPRLLRLLPRQRLWSKEDATHPLHPVGSHLHRLRLLPGWPQALRGITRSDVCHGILLHLLAIRLRTVSDYYPRIRRSHL